MDTARTPRGLLRTLRQQRWSARCRGVSECDRTASIPLRRPTTTPAQRRRRRSAASASGVNQQLWSLLLHRAVATRCLWRSTKQPQQLDSWTASLGAELTKLNKIDNALRSCVPCRRRASPPPLDGRGTLPRAVRWVRKGTLRLLPVSQLSRRRNSSSTFGHIWPESWVRRACAGANWLTAAAPQRHGAANRCTARCRSRMCQRINRLRFVTIAPCDGSLPQS